MWTLEEHDRKEVYSQCVINNSSYKVMACLPFLELLNVLFNTREEITQEKNKP